MVHLGVIRASCSKASIVGNECVVGLDREVVLVVSAVEHFDEVVEQYHLAIGEFMKGNPEPAKKMISNRDDVTLANPRGIAKGRDSQRD
jgi:hypothetical protein